jgi:hypothetical protein
MLAGFLTVKKKLGSPRISELEFVSIAIFSVTRA